MRSTRKSVKGLLALLLATMSLLSACSSSNDEAAGRGETGSFPATIQGANGDVSLPAKPVRIVSLSPSATETLFAIGANNQVVAVDDQSDFPANAPMSELSGFTPNAEKIAAYRPDLVVLSNDMNGLVDSLRRLNVPTLVQPAANNLDEVYAQVRALGKATGRLGDADELANGMQRRIDAAVAGARRDTPNISYYHEVDPSLYSITSETFLGQVYNRFGLRNIADRPNPAGNNYPQLSAESVISSDPSLIFLADSQCCGQSAATVAARPGWSNVAAVKNGMVFPVDDDIASRWGPRTADFVEAVAAAVGKLPR